MSEQSTPNAEKTVQIDLEALGSVGAEISALDTQISAASGSESAVRKAITAGFASDHAGEIDKILELLMPQFSNLNVEVLAGLMSRLPEAMEEEFEPSVKELVDAKVTEATSGAKENLATLREQRKAKVEAFKALKAILEQFGVDTSSVPEPKRGGGRPSGSGGGGAAKSGKNRENYRYAIDGQNRPPSQNTVSSLAYYSTQGCAGTEENPERWGTKQLKEFIAEQGVTWGPDGEGDDTWEVTLPNGKVISGRRMTPDLDPDIFTAEPAGDDVAEEASTEEVPAED